MLVDLPRTHHVHLYVVEEEIAKQTQNEPVNEHVSEDVFEQAEIEFMFIEPSTEPQVETFSEDVFGQCETEHCSEHYTEPATEPHVEHPTEPLAEPQTESQTEFQTEPQDEPQTQPPTKPQTDPQTQTEPKAETISEANMEPEHEPSRFDDTEPDDSQDSDYNGSSRTDSITSSFDDTNFSVEDVSQYHVDVEMDFEGHFGTEPSAARRRVESEFESDVSDSLHSVDESDSDSGIKKKKKKKRLPEFNIATDMDNPDFKGFHATILFQQYFPLIGYLMNSWTNVTKHPHNKKYTAIWFNLLEVKINGLQMRLAPHLTSNLETTPWQT
ncbi:hypothetical protein V6N13_130184 [Hibiscus sabdariffa]